MTPDLQKGTELADRYTLLRKLGAGADTQTWLASDRMTRASVALKVLHSERIPAELLRKEWQTSIRLMHAHIVRVFEFHDEDDLTFYSLQFVDGADISVLSGAPLADVLPPIALIADALRYAHNKGVVHRDIKASNVLLDQNGAPYLSDFGAAAQASANASGGSLIAASPESLAGENSQPSDDVFALGGLIYELVSGNSPYSSSNTAEDIRAHVPPPLAAASGENVPASVQQLVAAMLEKNAAERPDAAAVVDALAAAGFPAGTAPTSYFEGRPTSGSEVIEASASLHARKSTQAPVDTVQASNDSGISPRTLGIGLAALILLLIGVVFVLPKTVSTDSEDVVAGVEETAGEEQESQSDETTTAIPDRDERVVARAETEAVLGQLLSKMATLESRAVQRWGGLRFKKAQEIYNAADAAYLARDYATASDLYAEAIEAVDPLLDEVDAVFSKTFGDAQAALESANTADAVRLFELAVAISPSHAEAQSGYLRAKNLDTVLSLTDQGLAFEKGLELIAARESFERAVEIDPQWQPAQEGLARVEVTMRDMEFDMRMTEGLVAINDGHYDAARAAFRMAKELKPDSPEPTDGLLQVDQEVRLNRIRSLEQQALAQRENEEWETLTSTFESILEIDDSLEFAQLGLLEARQMVALHEQLDAYIAAPDSLSSSSTMQRATNMVVDITRMPNIGPRLSGQRDELSRLLKRAATPLQVKLVSDNATDVSIYKVGKLGSFATHELSLRPGKYVAVGSRPGFRDVRLEFRIGPELEATPIVIRCEEAI
ncbi:MAG: protein kinase domain-containing protein [Woeseiaceae bacterium]